MLAARCLRTPCSRHSSNSCERPIRRHLVISCRYDRRVSANNADQRRMDGRKRRGKGLLSENDFARANETVEQPQLLSVNVKQIAARMQKLSEALGLSVADIGDVLSRCPALLDVLPLRLQAALSALVSAADINQSQALFMLSSDLNLLDVPPLHVRQYLEQMSQALQAPWQAITQMAWQCPALLRVELVALQLRWSNLQSVLQIPKAALHDLLALEPRLLMPSSTVLAANHADILNTLNISQRTLRRWVFAAPMLLLVPAVQLQKRVNILTAVLGAVGEELLGLLAAEQSKQTFTAVRATASTGVQQESSSHDSGSSLCSSSSQWLCVTQQRVQIMAYISKDPRVLLLNLPELQHRVREVANELGLGFWVAAWLVMSHPSYLAVEAGLITKWIQDVQHLTDMTLRQATRLASCPQVFLTMGPEDILANLASLGETLNAPTNNQVLDIDSALVNAIAADEPLLLLQHPSATSTALRQLHTLLQQQQLRQRLILAVPALLLQGKQLQEVYGHITSLFSLSGTQLAGMFVLDPGLWLTLVPRHTWPCRQQQPPGSQARQLPAAGLDTDTDTGSGVRSEANAAWHLSPAAQTAAATMSTLVHCGMRSPDVMQAAVVLHPLLLQLTPAEALDLVQIIQERCAACSMWQQQLEESLSPDQVGKALGKAAAWDDRLAFLVSTGWASRVHFGDVVEWTKRDFNHKFEEQFGLWQMQQAQSGGYQQGAGTLLQYRQGQQSGMPGRQQQQGHIEWGDDLAVAVQAKMGGRASSDEDVLVRRANTAAGVSDIDSRSVLLPAQHLQADQQESSWSAGDAADSPCSSHAIHNSSSNSSFDDTEEEQEEEEEEEEYAGDGVVSYHQGQPNDHSTWGYSSLHERLPAQTQARQQDLIAQEWQSVDAALQQQEALEHVQEQQQGDPNAQVLHYPEGQQQEQYNQQLGQVISYQHQHTRFGSSDASLQHPQQQSRRQAVCRLGRHLPNSVRWSATRQQMATASVQLSGLELYGSWLGCLLQPADALESAAAVQASNDTA